MQILAEIFLKEDFIGKTENGINEQNTKKLEKLRT